MRIVDQSEKKVIKKIKKDIFVEVVIRMVLNILKNDQSFKLDEKINKLSLIEKHIVKKEKNLKSLLETSDILYENIVKETEIINTNNKIISEKLIKILKK